MSSRKLTKNLLFITDSQDTFIIPTSPTSESQHSILDSQQDIFESPAKIDPQQSIHDSQQDLFDSPDKIIGQHSHVESQRLIQPPSDPTNFLPQQSPVDNSQSFSQQSTQSPSDPTNFLSYSQLSIPTQQHPMSIHFSSSISQQSTQPPSDSTNSLSFDSDSGRPVSLLLHCLND